jgi:hypothetical protein
MDSRATGYAGSPFFWINIHMDKYSDQEMEAFLGCILAGYTVKEAVNLCGLDPQRTLETYEKDWDLRNWTLNLSMLANENIHAGKTPRPLREDDYYDDVDWGKFYRQAMQQIEDDK